ncbi:MAG: BrnT family toxin [Chromatiales bacterium]|nr:BrnT family toxin [Chromatiales bacterium]
MDIEHDPSKDTLNRAKHGLALRDAVALDWDELLWWPDQRRDYGEPRFVGLAPMGNRLYCVVYTMRGDSIRIISLRKANAHEVRWYAAEDKDR